MATDVLVPINMDKVIGCGELWWGEDEYGVYVAYSNKQNDDNTLPLITFGDMIKFMHDGKE